MNEDMAANHADLLKDVLRDQPTGRLGGADEIAAAVLWLCSPAASFVLGVALSVDGAFTAQQIRLDDTTADPDIVSSENARLALDARADLALSVGSRYPRQGPHAAMRTALFGDLPVAAALVSDQITPG